MNIFLYSICFGGLLTIKKSMSAVDDTVLFHNGQTTNQFGGYDEDHKKHN